MTDIPQWALDEAMRRIQGVMMGKSAYPLAEMIAMHEIWRWLYRESARLIQEQAECIAKLEEHTP